MWLEFLQLFQLHIYLAHHKPNPGCQVRSQWLLSYIINRNYSELESKQLCSYHVLLI